MADFDPNAYLEKYGKQDTGFSPDAYLNKYASNESKKPEIEAPEQSGEAPIWKKAIETTGKTLDWPGGVARAALAGAASIPRVISGEDSLVNLQDLKHALAGPMGPGATRSSEYMQRAGVPEGDIAHYPLLGDLSARDVGGFAMDIATDPLTALSHAGTAGMNYLDKGTEAVGKTVFKSGLKKIDQAVAEKGAQPLSDVLISNGISGTTKQIRSASEKLLNDTKSGRDALHAEADAAGAMVDPSIAFKDSLDKVTKMGERDPGLKELADKLKEKIQTYIDHGPVPLSQASEWKTNLNSAMPESSFDKFGRLKGPADRINKSMAGGLKREIEASGNRVSEGLGDEIGAANDQMQTLLTARKPLKTAAKAAENINAVTSVDAMLAGLGGAATHNLPETAAILAAKKAADLSKTTAARTTAGRAIMGLGNTNSITPFVNQSIIHSPWANMQQGGE